MYVWHIIYNKIKKYNFIIMNKAIYFETFTKTKTDAVAKILQHKYL